MDETAQAPAASTQAPAKDTPVYELGFHVVPTVGDDGVSAVVESIRKLLGDAEIISEGFPQKMQLAYQVERSTQGKREKYNESYFGWIKFATERETIPALEKWLKDAPSVLRSLIIQTVREDIAAAPRRAVFSSDRLEGKTLEKPLGTPEKAGEVSQEELDKSIEALTG